MEHHWWNEIPAFYFIFGFLGCATMILVSKFIGKKILIRDENYYGDNDE